MTTAITFPSVKEIESLKKLTVHITSLETKADAEKQLARIRLASRNLKLDIAAAKKPYKDAIEAIDDAAKQWSNSLFGQDQAIEQALIAYNTKTRARVATSNANTTERFETKVTTEQAKAIANNTQMKIIAPPVLQVEPGKTVYTEEARLTESGYWTWDSIAGIKDGQKGAKELSITEAKRLELDLPDEWFFLDTAMVTSCVKKQDRVPRCIIQRHVDKIVVTATK